MEIPLTKNPESRVHGEESRIQDCLGAKVENISSNHRKQALHEGRKLRGTLDVLLVYEELLLFQKEMVKFVKLNTLNQKQSKYFV